MSGCLDIVEIFFNPDHMNINFKGALIRKERSCNSSVSRKNVILQEFQKSSFTTFTLFFDNIRVTRRLKKKLPYILKSGQKCCLAKNAIISATKLNLKVQNIYLKPLLKP